MSLAPRKARSYSETMTNEGLKLAITGKGGVGKTTLTALLAGAYAESGREVLAIDATPLRAWGRPSAFLRGHWRQSLPYLRWVN
jgi:CO dehydrogenase maturation factor